MLAFGIGFTLSLLEFLLIKGSAPSLCLASLGLRYLKMERHTGSVQQNQGDTGRALTLRECSISVHLIRCLLEWPEPHSLLKVNRGGKPKIPSRAAIWGKSKS